VDEQIKKAEEKPIDKVGIKKVETTTAPKPEHEDYVVIIKGGFAATIPNAKSADWAEGRVVGELTPTMKQIGFQITSVETIKKSEAEKRAK